ncbi:phosphotransferase [Planctobacterium marinum]|uniref:phosphotransferase n=1 Tax=Planctobacterium marinum TaxID=1631968 RepID=UPI001E3C57F7|nr:phosphotransferase [Planctobacterium marinum]MCC2604772.1 phosphotransferase [Planctobacterium marinum]
MSEFSITTFLESVLDTRHFQISPYESQGTNLHYRVDAQQTYFLKVFQTNQLQVVSRPKQFHIQRQVASQALAPRPVALSGCETFWLEEWANEAAVESVSGSVDIINIAESMARVHSLKVQADHLDIQAEWHRYIELGQLALSRYGPKIDRLLALFERHNERIFCHNDLHRSHIILNSRGMTLLDWEYAALGNRYFDLAACIQVNAFTVQQQEVFLRHYAQLAGLQLQETEVRTHQMLTVVDFTAELWHNAYNHINKSVKK